MNGKSATTFAEVQSRGDIPQVPDEYTLGMWLKAAKTLYSRAQAAETKGDLIEAYVMYSKTLNICLECIPAHRDYNAWKSNIDSQPMYMEYKVFRSMLYHEMNHITAMKNQVQSFLKARRLSTPAPPDSLGSNTEPVRARDNRSTTVDLIAARLSRLSTEHAPRRQSIPHDSRATKPVGARPMLPKSLSIEPRKVLEYREKFPGLSLLFLDVRSQEEYEASHIGLKNVINIDPIVCRPNLKSQDLEDSFAVGPADHLDLFQRRNEFDLIIYYDSSSRSTLPQETASIYHPEALLNLHTTLWEHSGWQKPLVRAPVLLVGGLDAWAAAGGPVYTRGNTSLGSNTASEVPKRVSSATSVVIQQPIYSSSVANAKLRNRGTSVMETTEQAYPRSVHEYIFADTSRQQSMVKNGPPSPTRPPNFSRPTSFTRPPQSPGPERRSLTPISSPYLESRQLPDKPHRLGAAPVYHRQPSLGAQSSRLGQTTIGKTGLKNLGNSCFMNAVLQCLAACFPLARYFTSGQWRQDVCPQNPLGYRGNVAKEFAKVLMELNSDDNSVVAPVSLRNQLGVTRPEFASNEQQDAQELLNFVLDAIHEDLNSNALNTQLRELNQEEETYRESLKDSFVSEVEWKRHTHRNMSIIVKLFQGQLQSRLRCLTCGHTSTTYNAFSSLSLPIPAKRSAVNLEDCVNEFVKTESMSGDDSWFCAKCQVKRNACKKLSISKLPDVLVLHFKRFESNGRWRDKLNTNISYPLSGLDMTKYLGSSLQEANPVRSVYDIFGIVYHRGSMEGGHYTAMVNFDAANAGDWTLFDDSRVAPNNEIDGRASYLLFYSKRPNTL